MRFGVHMAQKGGFAKNVKRVATIGGSTIQVFPGNPTGWKMGKLEMPEIEKRVALLEANEIYPLVVHSAYLINLASNHPDFLTKSKQLLDATMERAAYYRSPYVVLHTGNHGGQGVKKGLAQIVECIGAGLSTWPESVQLLLENTAGSGTALGANFAELAAVLQSFAPGKLGVCFDTAHAWAAGYDLGSAAGAKRALAEMDRLVGLEHLKVIHVNDTRVECGSRVDRHAHIGAGNITLEGFGAILNYGWPKDFPFILETPENGSDWDRINLEQLRALM